MKKRQKKALEELTLIIFVFVFVFVWFYTKDLIAALTVILGLFGIYALIIYLVHLKKQNELKSAGMEEIDQMSGAEFEKYLFFLFQKAGFKVSQTRAVGDYGADLVITDFQSGEKIVVQAKRYKRNVGIKAVQEVVGSINHYKADSGWVVTNSNFTNLAIQLANSNGIRLMDREKLVKLINKVNKTGR